MAEMIQRMMKSTPGGARETIQVVSGERESAINADDDLMWIEST